MQNFKDRIMKVQISEVNTPKGMKDFITFPLELYKDDRNFVFEPIALQQDFFSKKKNKFFEHSDVKFFLAKLENEIVGRIAVINNTIHNKTYNEKTGFFGFFETINDYEVAKLLLDKAFEIHKANGFNKIVGPTNFTTNDSCGILVSGFEYDPVVLMPYNKPYYADFLVQYGYKSIMDLSSYYFEYSRYKSFFDRPIFNKMEDKLAENNIIIRPLDFKNFENETLKLWKLYNSSNESNWGFVPLTKNEFFAMASDLKKMIPKDLILLAEHKKELVGFFVSIPDYNQVFKKMKNGKFLPWGVFKFFWYKSKISKARILILGVDSSYRNQGIDLILYKRITQNLVARGITKAEACYVMANNGNMNSILRKMNGIDSKKYRIYSYLLPA